MESVILKNMIVNTNYSDVDTPFCDATLTHTLSLQAPRVWFVFSEGEVHKATLPEKTFDCFHTTEMTASKNSGASEIDDSQNMNSGKNR